MFDEAQGISEGLYVNWQLKGVLGMIPVENMMLNLKKIMEGVNRQWLKFTKSWKKKHL